MDTRYLVELFFWCFFVDTFPGSVGSLGLYIPRPDFQISGLDRVVRAVRAVSPVPVG